MRRLRPRTAPVAAVVALVALGGCSVVSGGSTEETPKEIKKVRYLTGFAMQAQDAFMFLAKEKGFFRSPGSMSPCRFG